MTEVITQQETELAHFCIAYLQELGASASRVSLSKNVTDSVTFFNGKIDKVTHSSDRSVFIYIFADGKYGTFSTNRLEKNDLKAFMAKALDTVRMLEADPCRCLPESSRTAKDALTGKEAGLFDPAYFCEDIDSRLEKVRSMCLFEKIKSENLEGLYGKDLQAKTGANTGEAAAGWSLISEECEWNDSIDDTLLLDSQGLEARHTETSAGVFCEMNVTDTAGNKYSGYWWDSSTGASGVDIKGCSAKALEKVLGQFAPRRSKGGRYRMVVDTSVASRLVTPLVNALNTSSIEQKTSFLEDSLGKKIFPDSLTIMDLGRETGKLGARFYDSEGVATKNAPIIMNGTVMQYFTNTYLAKKTGFEPTAEDVSRPCIMPTSPEHGSLQEILKECGSGFYVTGFNGGNSNPVTGDFSFGVEGFRFSRGLITHPIKEMVITGNLIKLWNSLISTGNDARPCTRWQIPTLAFDTVDFSA